MRWIYTVWMAFLMAGGLATDSGAETLRVLAWNVESGGEADPVTIAERILGMPSHDVWVFTEVRDRKSSLDLKWGIETASGRPYDYVLSRSGRAEKMLVIFDRTRIDLLDRDELDKLNDGLHRSPLVVRIRVLANDQEILLVVNHLSDEKKSLKTKQVDGLNAWAQGQSLPVLGVGTYYFDWKVIEGDRKHKEAFDRLTKDGAWSWIRPRTLVRTQHSPANAVEDFVFGANLPETWRVASEILVAPGDFPDNDETPDHRPVAAVVEMP